MARTAGRMRSSGGLRGGVSGIVASATIDYQTPTIDSPPDRVMGPITWYCLVMVTVPQTKSTSTVMVPTPASGTTPASGRTPASGEVVIRNQVSPCGPSELLFSMPTTGSTGEEQPIWAATIAKPAAFTIH